MKILTSPPKKIMYKFLFFTCFWSAEQQLSFGKHSGGGVISSIPSNFLAKKPVFMLFGRVDNLFLTGRQRPSTSIQPCPMGDGWLYTSESN